MLDLGHFAVIVLLSRNTACILTMIPIDLVNVMKAAASGGEQHDRRNNVAQARIMVWDPTPTPGLVYRRRWEIDNGPIE